MPAQSSDSLGLGAVLAGHVLDDELLHEAAVGGRPVGVNRGHRDVLLGAGVEVLVTSSDIEMWPLGALSRKIFSGCSSLTPPGPGRSFHVPVRRTTFQSS
jgi:hypothetical protein